MTEPGLPLTTGEGNTALWDEPPDAQITPEQAHEVAANWKDTTQLSNALDAMANECGRLREQLDAEKREHDDTAVWLSEANALLGKAIEQLDAARQALAAIDEVTGPYDDGYVEEVKKILARAALGVEGPAAVREQEA